MSDQQPMSSPTQQSLSSRVIPTRSCRRVGDAASGR